MHLIRPLAGRLHCGWSADWRRPQKQSISSDRSPVGSIAAATTSPRSPSADRPHPTARRSAPLRLHRPPRRRPYRPGPHPTARRSAPLRLVLVPRPHRQGHLIRPLAGRLHCGRFVRPVKVTRSSTSSDRSPVGSIAASRLTTSSSSLPTHPTARRSAPLRRQCRGCPCCRCGLLIRPLAGRLHCGVPAGRPRNSARVPHPTARRSAPLRPQSHDRSDGADRPHPTARRSAPLRLACESPISRITPTHPTARRSAPLRRLAFWAFDRARQLIRPLAGRLHCGATISDPPGAARPPHPTARRSAPLRQDGGRTLKVFLSAHPTARRSAPLRLRHGPAHARLLTAHPTARRSAPLRRGLPGAVRRVRVAHPTARRSAPLRPR